MGNLAFVVLYFAPSLIAWYRSRQGKPIILPLGSLFVFNLFLAWTIVGWFLVLANALGKNPVAAVAPRLAAHLVKLSPAGLRPSIPQGSPSSAQGATCSMCQGTGSMTCSSCGGRGSWYDPPQGAYGTAQLHNCPACISSGRIRCTYCGGSGRVAGY